MLFRSIEMIEEPTGMWEGCHVAKVKLKDKEIMMYVVDDFNINDVTADYINTHALAHNHAVTPEAIKAISDAFTKTNVAAIEKVLGGSKEDLLNYYARQPEKSIRDSYIKIVLSDICDELFQTLKNNVIKQTFNYNIDGSGDNLYVGVNFKIILLRVLYDQIAISSRKYWVSGVDEALKDPYQPNFGVISNLLDKIL